MSDIYRGGQCLVCFEGSSERSSGSTRVDRALLLVLRHEHPSITPCIPGTRSLFADDRPAIDLSPLISERVLALSDTTLPLEIIHSNRSTTVDPPPTSGSQISSPPTHPKEDQKRPHSLPLPGNTAPPPTSPNFPSPTSAPPRSHTSATYQEAVVRLGMLVGFGCAGGIGRVRDGMEARVCARGEAEEARCTSSILSGGDTALGIWWLLWLSLLPWIDVPFTRDCVRARVRLNVPPTDGILLSHELVLFLPLFNGHRSRIR